MATALTSDISIIGKVDASTVADLAGRFKGWLYVAKDSADDTQIGSEGFKSLGAIAGLAKAHVALDKNALSLASVDQAVTALASLPSPTLISCGTSGRAGVVALVHLAKANHWTVDQAMSFASEHKMALLGHAACKDLAMAALASLQHRRPPIFRQLFEEKSWTYTYLLGCPRTREAILIDPVDVTAERDARILAELGLNLKYALNTHMHADHVTGTGKLRKLIPDCKSVIALASGAKADVHINDNDLIRFGDYFVEARSTPGHTNGCMTYVLDDRSKAFTGDTLLIRGCGRTDFQQGSSEGIYNSIHSRIFCLPQETELWPGHDYKGYTVSTVEEEKKHNLRVNKSLPEFCQIMANLNLGPPKQLAVAIPANAADGIVD